MQRGGNGVPALLLIMVAVGGFGVVLLRNSQPAPSLRVIVPTQSTPTVPMNAWEAVLQEGFGSDSTPLPTVAIPTAPFIPSTLAVNISALTPIAPGDVAGGVGQPVAIGATPTPRVLDGASVTSGNTTPGLLPTIIPVTALYITQAPQEWNPPPLIAPISRDPLGRDHYWFERPVNSNANNQGLFYYPYGSDGPEDQWRVHAGIDMPNPIGETVRAAGNGVVTFAANGVFQDTYSYGNVVRVEHDFGYDGQRLYTVYAHLSAVLVTQGQLVRAGDPIGLVGNTGRTTGPHVHFEVRMNEDNYGATLNPVLWMVPYVGTGTLVGRVTDVAGNLVMDTDITVREYARGLVTDTTTTYIFAGTGVDVNPDPVWEENFVVGDVPVGRYEIIANIGGERVSKLVNIIEGTTTFIELSPATNDPPTPQALDGA